nr:MAG TPA: Minor capsid protein [Caudoviricetes sp.]
MRHIKAFAPRSCWTPLTAGRLTSRRQTSPAVILPQTALLRPNWAELLNATRRSWAKSVRTKRPAVPCSTPCCAGRCDMLTFKVQTNLSEALAAAIGKAATRAEHIVAVQAAKDTSPYVPFLTGSLDERTRVSGNTIIYPGPYARYLYYGKVMVDPETGSTYAKKGMAKVLTDKNLVFTKYFHNQAQSHWFEASKAQNLEKWRDVAGKAMKQELD